MIPHTDEQNFVLHRSKPLVKTTNESPTSPPLPRHQQLKAAHYWRSLTMQTAPKQPPIRLNSAPYLPPPARKLCGSAWGTTPRSRLSRTAWCPREYTTTHPITATKQTQTNLSLSHTTWCQLRADSPSRHPRCTPACQQQQENGSRDTTLLPAINHPHDATCSHKRNTVGEKHLQTVQVPDDAPPS